MKDALLEIENIMKSYNGTFKIKIEVIIVIILAKNHWRLK